MRTDDVGYLKACRIEVLRGGVHHHAIVGDSTKRHELVARHDEFAVDLITHHLHAMLLTDVVHSQEFFARPDASTRIMRVAEQEDGGLFVSALRLEIDEIDLEGIVHTPQSRLQHLAAIVLDTGEETVIGRRQDQYFLARHRQGLNDTRHRRDYGCRVKYPLALDFPLMTATEPGYDCLVITLRHDVVAKHAVFHPLLQGLLDGWCHTEVHICHPQGNHAIVWAFIPLHAPRAPSLYYFIEIKHILFFTTTNLTN